MVTDGNCRDARGGLGGDDAEGNVGQGERRVLGDLEPGSHDEAADVKDEERMKEKKKYTACLG